MQGREGRVVVVGWSRVLWLPPSADSYLLAQEHTQLLFWDSPYCHLSTELHCHTGEFIFHEEPGQLTTASERVAEEADG